MSRPQNPEAYLQVAAETPLFSGIPADEVRQCLLKDGVRRACFEKGEVLYAPERFSRCIGFLVSGRASVTKNGPDGGMLMSILHAGEVFGAATLFSRDGRYVATIRALAATQAVLLSEDAFRTMMQADFRIAENYMAYLTARIRFLSGRIDGFAQGSAEERVLLHIEKNAADGAYAPEYSMRALSDALCMGRTTLYRALDNLEREGKIKRDGKAFRLCKGEKES